MTGSRELAIAAAEAASAKQGRNILVLDVTELIGITDYFVVASGQSDRQVRTLAEEVEKALRSRGVRPVRREGVEEARWVLLDYVDFVVHLFVEQDREYYGLERLWADAARVAWDARAASSG